MRDLEGARVTAAHPGQFGRVIAGTRERSGRMSFRERLDRRQPEGRCAQRDTVDEVPPCDVAVHFADSIASATRSRNLIPSFSPGRYRSGAAAARSPGPRRAT